MKLFNHALEDLDLEPKEGISEIPNEDSEIEHIEEYSDAIGEALDTASAMESIAESMDSNSNVKAIQIAVEHMLARVGTYQGNVSLESFEDVKFAVSSIKDRAREIIEAIIKTVKNLTKHFIDFIGLKQASIEYDKKELARIENVPFSAQSESTEQKREIQIDKLTLHYLTCSAQRDSELTGNDVLAYLESFKHSQEVTYIDNIRKYKEIVKKFLSELTEGKAEEISVYELMEAFTLIFKGIHFNPSEGDKLAGKEFTDVHEFHYGNHELTVTLKLPESETKEFDLKMLVQEKRQCLITNVYAPDKETNLKITEASKELFKCKVKLYDELQELKELYGKINESLEKSLKAEVEAKGISKYNSLMKNLIKVVNVLIKFSSTLEFHFNRPFKSHLKYIEMSR